MSAMTAVYRSRTRFRRWRNSAGVSSGRAAPALFKELDPPFGGPAVPVHPIQDAGDEQERNTRDDRSNRDGDQVPELAREPPRDPEDDRRQADRPENDEPSQDPPEDPGGPRRFLGATQRCAPPRPGPRRGTKRSGDSCRR